MDWSVVLGSSAIGAVLGAIIGAVIKAKSDRRAAKKIPKTEMRAEAYRDFMAYTVRCVHRQKDPGDEAPEGSADFHDITARLLLFGESDVVNAAAQLVKHESLTTAEAEEAFCHLVRKMRASLLTGSEGIVIASAKTLAHSKPWGRAARV